MIKVRDPEHLFELFQLAFDEKETFTTHMCNTCCKKMGWRHNKGKLFHDFKCECVYYGSTKALRKSPWKLYEWCKNYNAFYCITERVERRRNNPSG